MTNEMKLLMALCDALGFDVEEVQEWNAFNSGDMRGGAWKTIDYKLTKKKSSVQEKIDKARDIDCYQAMSGRRLHLDNEAIFSGDAEYWSEILKGVTL